MSATDSLGAAIRAAVEEALSSSGGQRALAEAVREAVGTEVRRALQERDADALLDTNALARLLGCTARALRARLSRGSPLASIALLLDGRRMWRRAEVMRVAESAA